MGKLIKSKARELILIAAIIVIAVIICLFQVYGLGAKASFVSSLNITNILYSNAVFGIMAMGMMMVITTGNIDVSIGAQYAIAGMVVALVAKATGGNYPLVAILAGMGTGLILGLVNGLIVAKLKIPAIVVTLGTMNIMRGTLNLITSGNWIDGLGGAFAKFANLRPLKAVFNLLGKKGPAMLFNLPLAVYIWLIVMIFTYIFLYRTKFGRDILAVGGNKEAAKRMGLSSTKAYLLSFGYMGMLAGLAASIAASKIKIAQPSNGTGYEMKLIAACVIGGTEFSGGIASILGTFLGVLLLGVIENGLVLTKVPTYWQDLATGIIIILAVASGIFRSLKGSGKKTKNGGEHK
ncbi:MAG: ABC transporter permease [Clostridia bacterium]|nr:ABC transporter permease [Clostridia bacterium]